MAPYNPPSAHYAHLDVCLFDNDSAGKKLSENFTNTYNIPHFFVPELPGVTDFSDLVKALGIEKASDIINTNLKELWIK